MDAEIEERINDNIRLVDYTLQKKLHIKIDSPYYEDCQQEGRYGLILASMRYDDMKEISFATYAVSYIEGYVKRYMREFLHRKIHIPRKMMDLLHNIYRLQYEGYEKEEIIKELDISINEYEELLATVNINSINSILKDSEDSLYLEDMLGRLDPDIENIGERILR